MYEYCIVVGMKGPDRWCDVVCRTRYFFKWSTKAKKKNLYNDQLWWQQIVFKHIIYVGNTFGTIKYFIINYFHLLVLGQVVKMFHITIQFPNLTMQTPCLLNQYNR